MTNGDDAYAQAVDALLSAMAANPNQYIRECENSPDAEGNRTFMFTAQASVTVYTVVPEYAARGCRLLADALNDEQARQSNP